MFELNGKFYTMEQIQESAKRSNLGVEEYMQRVGFKKQDQAPPAQKPLDPEVEQAFKTREALNKFSFTPEELEENKKSYQQEADKLFVTKDKFPVKKEAISAGIGSPGYIIEKQVAPFEGYYDYIEKAKKAIKIENPTDEDVLNKSKELYIADREKNSFTEKLEDLAISNDLKGEDSERKLQRIMKSGKAVYETDAQFQERFLEEQETATEVISNYLQEDLKEKGAALKEYENKVKSLDNLAESIISKKYYTESEVNSANNYLKSINKQKKAIADDYIKTYDKILSTAVDYDQNEAILDIVKRSYKPTTVFATKTAASVLNIASGVLSIPEWMTINIADSVSKDQTPLIVKGTSYLAKNLKKASYALSETVERPIDIEQVNSVSDMGSWAIDVVANQLPILAVLAANPVAGLSVLSGSSLGNKYSDMIDEANISGKDYSNWQLFSAPLIVGGAEYLSERVTLNQITSLKKLFRKNNTVLESAKDYLKNKITPITVASNIASEAGSEVAAKLAENATDILILQKPDVHIWDGVPNAAASGAFMSGVIFNAPAIGARLLKPFIGEDINQKLMGNTAMINKISTELAKENIDQTTRVQLEVALRDVIVDNNRILAQAYNSVDDQNFDGNGDQRKRELININVQQEIINAKNESLTLDKTKDTETKRALSNQYTKQFQELDKRKNEILQEVKDAINKKNNPYKDVSDEEFDTLMEQDIAKTASYIESFGLNNVEQKVFNGIDEQIRFLEENGASIERIESVKKARPSGFLYTVGDKSFLVVDKVAMKKRQKVNSSEHEFLHAVLLNTFRFNPEFQKKAGSELLQYVKGYIEKNQKLQNTEFGKRLKAYSGAVADGLISESQAMEEVFTLLSDAFTRRTIEYNPDLLENIGNYTRRALQRYGLKDITFEKPSDIFNFVADFNFNYKNNAFGKAFKNFAQKSLTPSTPINPDNVQEIGQMDASFESLNKIVDDLVGEKDADGNYKMTKKEWLNRGIERAYNEIIIGDMLDGLIVSGYLGPTIYGQPKENFIEEIKYRKNGLSDMLINFNPEINDSLIGWINNQLGKRKLQVESDFRIKLLESPITAEMEKTVLGSEDIIDDYQEVEVDLNRINKLIDASNIIGDVMPEFNQKIKDVNLFELYFKNVPNLVSETLSKATGIAENKILNPQDNLSTEEFNSGKKYIFNYLDKIIKILPKANISEQASIEFAGRSTGVPKSILEVFYNKQEKNRWSKKDISKKEALAGFGMNPDGTSIQDLSPRSTEAQRVKAIISLIGKLASNTKIRQYMKDNGVPLKNILDIEAGKSRFMMDMDPSLRDERIDSERVVYHKTLVLNDKELTDIYTASKIDEQKAIEILQYNGLSKDQATDLHRSISGYKPEENIARLKKENRFIYSYRNSYDYDVFIKEAAIKEQLDLTGKDLEMNSPATKTLILRDIIKPALSAYESFRIKEIEASKEKTVDEKIKDSLIKAQEGEIIKLIYDNFYSENNRKILNEKGDVIGKTNTGAKFTLFESKQDFAKFINQTSSFSGFKVQFNDKGQLVALFKTSSGNILSTTVLSEPSSFVKAKTDRDGLEDFHNGKKQENSVLEQQNLRTEQAKKVFRVFLKLIDEVKQEAYENRTSIENIRRKDPKDIFNKKTLAAFMLILNSKPNSYTNYLYDVVAITKNENAPEKISKQEAKKYYDFKTNIPQSEVIKLLTLYFTDIGFDINSINASLSSLKGEYVPSGVKAFTVKEAQKKAEEQEKKIVQKVTPKREVLLTKQDVYNKKLEDTLGDMIASKSRKDAPKESIEIEGEIIQVPKKGTYITPAAVIDEVSAAKFSAFKKAKSGTIISPSVADHYNLIQAFYRDGKLGEQDKKFFEDNLIRKYNIASLKLDVKRQEIANQFKAVTKSNIKAVRSLNEITPFFGYTNEDAIKIYLYYKSAHNIPGIEDESLKANIAKYVEKNKTLLDYANALISIYPGEGKWMEPSGMWMNRSIKQDVVDSVEKELRKTIFSEWIAVKDAVFSKNNMNKILAVYGRAFHSALKDSLFRMETGSSGNNMETEAGRKVFNFLRGSIGVTMFFNSRSALLQLISTFNYIDVQENNIFDVAQRISDLPQFAKDIHYLFNSDYLKQRRGGLQTDVQEQEIAAAIEKGGIGGFYKLLMKNGFAFTKAGDSAAISFLGATYYRTKVLKYLQEGKNQKDAEKEAFLDFYAKTEESQQSARPDRISKQQTTFGGRLFLAYQNSILQYNRIMIRSLKDLAAGRGNKADHISKIAYYGFVQNVMFTFAQQAYLYFLFSDEEEKEEESIFDDRTLKVVNGVLDTTLRGFGIYGGVFAAAKNTILEGIKQKEKQEQGGVRRSEYVLIQAANVSPIISSKARAGISAFNNWVDQDKMYSEMGLSLYNPALDAGSQALAVLNIPANRLLQKLRNIEQATNEQNDITKRILYLGGWNTYDFRYQSEELAKTKARLKRLQSLKSKQKTKSINIRPSKKSLDKKTKIISRKEIPR